MTPARVDELIAILHDGDEWDGLVEFNLAPEEVNDTVAALELLQRLRDPSQREPPHCSTCGCGLEHPAKTIVGYGVLR